MGFPIAVSDVPLVRPWRLDEALDWLSDRLQTPIDLVPWPADHRPSSGRCGGMTVLGETGIVIRWDAQRSPGHQARQIGHEIGHLFAGHHLRSSAQSIPADLFPDLNIGAVHAVLRRDIFTDPDELEAERIGSIIAADSIHRIGGRWSLAGSTLS